MEVIALLVILFGVVWLQGTVFGRMIFKKLEYRCGFSVKEAHEGDEILLVETVHNRKLLPVPWLKVDIHSSKWLRFAEANSVVTQENRRVTSSFFLKSYQKTVRRWKVKCLKRGVFTTENVTLTGGDLLNLGTESIPVRVDADLVVYPEVILLNENFIPVNYLQGDTIVKRWVIDDPFLVAGTREYTPRDPMNRIHWPATARNGKFMVRKNDFTSQFSLTVVLNIQSLEYEYKDVIEKDRIELGIKAAATVFDHALRTGMAARFACNGGTGDGDSSLLFTEQASGREHISSLLELLAKLELRNNRDFDDFFSDISGDISSNDIIVITCYVNDEICNTARALKNAGNSLRFIMLDHYIDISQLPGDLDFFVPAGVIQ